VAGIWAQAAGADGFRNPPGTAAALGKAGNHIVWVDDASAVFYNPANLVDVPSREVQLSALVGYSHADYGGGLLGGPTETERPWALLPSFSLAWPLHEKDQKTDLALGLGLHVPYGRQTRWESDGAFPLFTQMSVVDVSPALAWRISDSVSVGAGLDMYYGRLQFRQLLGPPLLPPGSRAEADADGFAVGGNVGITWRLTPNQRLALTCRSPFDLTFRGEMETANIPPPFAVPSSDLETTFKFPTIVALGYGIKLTETVSVEAKVEWLQFSRNKTLSVDAGQNALLAGALGLANAPQNWNDTWTFGIGPEWRFARDWTLRAGYLYLQSPIPDGTFSPMALDVDQSVVSLGLGYQKGRHAVDLAYALGLFHTRRVQGNQNPLFDGTYEFEGHLAALSYTYSF
jgi:long-chain fatty acid transport protein